MRDPVVEFQTYNLPLARRNPELLRYKVARMADGPFSFYRGTFHLFARDVLGEWANALPLTSSGAELDLVGDVHSENFGTFQADDGKVHYDINDFDETTRGRFGLDVCRLATSHFLAAQERPGETLETTLRLTMVGLRAYVDAVQRLLKKGKDLNLDASEGQPSGSAIVDGLVRDMAGIKRPAFVGKLTVWDGKGRRIVRTADYFNVPDQEREQALRLLADYRKRFPKQDREDFFAVEDVCGRVSGIGSMGRLRYVILLAGKGSADARNLLLEFKEGLPSAYDLYRNRDKDESALARRAERVVTIQKQSQAAIDPYAGWAIDDGRSFQARQRGPRDERVKFRKLAVDGLEGVIRVQGAILARVHARSAMRAVGPTNPLAELESPDSFCQRVMAFALAYADATRRDWQRFVGARADLDRVEGWAR